MTHIEPASPDFDQVSEWLEATGWTASRIEALEGDVSSRRYFRVSDRQGATVIVAWYPDDLHVACSRFEITAKLLDRVGVQTPEILEASCSDGFMMLEDVGAQTLFDLEYQPWEQLQPWFESGIDIVRRIQRVETAAVETLNPPLDATLMIRELDQTWTEFLEPNRLVGDAICATDLRDRLESLCRRLGSEPPVVCHRDLMVRNLVPSGGDFKLIVLDHQDLRIGPVFYDLASLCNDSIFPPLGIESSLIGGFISDDRQYLSYHRAAAQRTLKAIGTYERFGRRGTRRHLRLIPGTFERSLHHLGQLPDFADLLATIGPVWQAYIKRPSGLYNKPA